MPMIEGQGETIPRPQDNAEKWRRIIMEAVRALFLAIEKRDPYTAGHERRVADLSQAIGTELGLDQDRVEGIAVIGFLHDFGKIVVPSEILSKPAKLTEYEFELMQTHPQVGYEILKDLEFPWPVALTILQHHERLDGTGYPNNLTSDEISLESRIIAVADVVEAMSSHRPYRPALGVDKALEEIDRKSGVLFDAEVGLACQKVFRDKKFQFE